MLRRPNAAGEGDRPPARVYVTATCAARLPLGRKANGATGDTMHQACSEPQNLPVSECSVHASATCTCLLVTSCTRHPSSRCTLGWTLPLAKRSMLISPNPVSGGDCGSVSHRGSGLALRSLAGAVTMSECRARGEALAVLPDLQPWQAPKSNGACGSMSPCVCS